MRWEVLKPDLRDYRLESTAIQLPCVVWRWENHEKHFHRFDPSKEKFTSRAQSVFGNITTQRLLRPCWELLWRMKSTSDGWPACLCQWRWWRLCGGFPWTGSLTAGFLIRRLDKNISSLINLSAGWRNAWQSPWLNFKCGHDFFVFLEIGKTSIGRWTWSRPRWKCEICLCVIPPRDGCLISVIKWYTSLERVLKLLAYLSLRRKRAPSLDKVTS